VASVLVLRGGRVTQGECRQQCRGAVRSRAPRNLSGNFPAGQPTLRAHGCQAMRPAGPHRLIGALRGGGTPETAGNSTPSVRPPRGVRTATWGRTTSLRGVWGLWDGAATVGCWAGMGGSPAHLPWAHPFPWGPSRGAGHPVLPTVSLSVPVRGLIPSVPPGGPVGHPLCPPACPHLPVPSRSPSVSPGCPLGRDFPRGVPPAPARPNWIAPPPAGGRGSDVSRRGA